jgi:solute:Na+ symporter, SSS family
MTALDYSIIVAYMVFALGVGIFFSKKASKDTESYFLGGRSLPWWMIGISMAATSFASDTPLWTTEVIRTDGLQRLWWVLIAVMTLIVGIFLFSRLWRRAGIVTDAEFYELRYEGKSAAFLRGFRAFFSGIIQNVVTIGWVIFAMSSIIRVMTGIENQWVAVGICIVVALTYATFSGFYGVVVTDLVQFFLAIGSMIALAVIAVVNVGGMQAVLDGVAAQPGYGEATLSLFPDLTTFDMDTAKLLIIVLVFAWGDASGYNMQRMSACRDERDAVKATIFYAVFQTIRPWMWVVVGLVSIVIFPTLSEPYTDTHAYALVMDKYLGSGLRGLLVVSFLAAFMSTIDTHLNWGASYLMVDVYQRFVKKEASQKHYMRVTKVLVILLMCLGAAVVPMLKSITAAMEFMAMLMIGNGIIAVIRWFWWRINAFTEITAIVLGLVIGFANLVIPESVTVFGMGWTEIPFEIKIAAFTAIVIPLTLMVTLMTPPVSEAKLNAFYRKVRPGGFWAGASEEVRALPGKAMGPTILIDVLGAVLMCYGLSLGIGYAILMKFTHAAVCLALAVAGAVIVAKWFNKEVRRLKTFNEEGTSG